MDRNYMQEAIDLAKLGVGYTNPNPLVGALVVKENQIIARGYHAAYGQDHAEVMAIKNASESVVGATVYVTLEPCAHYGKTPPCANFLVASGIKKVVIGMVDPNPLVSGKGIKILNNHGIETVVGVLEEPIRKMNEIFIHYMTHETPFTILKYAMTLDGKLGTRAGHSQWISHEASRAYVHTIRHRVAGIMVGIGTVLTDDPLLSTRLEKGEGANPISIIIDRLGRIPLNAKLFSMLPSRPVWVVVGESTSGSNIEAIKAVGATVLVMPEKNEHIDLIALMIELRRLGIDSVLLEGGAQLAYGALNAGVVQKVMAFIAPKIVGGQTAKSPVGGTGVSTMAEALILKEVTYQIIGTDVLVEGYLQVKPCLQD